MSTKRKKIPQTSAPVVKYKPRPVDAAEVLDQGYYTYAMSVIEDRSIPSVADGLKPVARMLLWDMLKSHRVLPSVPHIKCARITGSTISLWHPHGDVAAYEALARLAQPFSLRVPLVDFHGSYGSPDFGAASQRYTEARLGAAAVELLAGIDSGSVEMVPNYDETSSQPSVLPAAFPNLLINGSYGMAVGISSFTPCHNPVEVVEATMLLLQNPKATIQDLLKVMPGPDFPDPAVVVNASELESVYTTGIGQVKIRGTWEFVEEKGTRYIVITSLPYFQGKTAGAERFIASVKDAVISGKVQGIVDIQNFSAQKTLSIQIELAKGVAPENVIAQLLKQANVPLQVTNSVRFNALTLDGKPKTFNLKTLLEGWINHRIDVIVRRSNKRIDVITDRLHLLDGLLAVLLDIDKAIKIIRAAEDGGAAKEALMSTFKLSDVQATYVLDMTLRRLTKLAKIEVTSEQESLKKELAGLQALLSSPGKIRKKVGAELAQTAQKLGWTKEAYPRTTVLTDETAPSTVSAVLDEPIEVVYTTEGYIQAFKSTAKIKAVKDQTTWISLPISTAEFLIVINNDGQMFKILGNNIPLDKPTALLNLVQLDNPLVPVKIAPQAFAEQDIFIVQSNGYVKRVGADALQGGDRKVGMSIAKLEKDEFVTNVFSFKDSSTYTLFTKENMAIRFNPKDVRPMGRTAVGVTGIKLNANDSVVGAAMDADTPVLVSAKGSLKRLDLETLPLQNRAGKGVKVAMDSAVHCVGSSSAVWVTANRVLVEEDFSKLKTSARDAVSKTKTKESLPLRVLS